MLVPSTLELSFGKSDQAFIIPKSTKPVEIDGVWSTKGEWTDASETKIVENGLTAYLRAKYDEGFLYILIDFVSDKFLDESGDWTVVCFDTKNDGGKTPDLDDYCFYVATRAGEMRTGIMRGNGKVWAIVQQAKLVDKLATLGYLQLNDPYDSTNKHVISEFRIPRHYGLQENMQFYLYLNNGYDNEFFEYPTNAGGKQFGIHAKTIRDVLATPNNWGNLRLKP